ncbi:testis-expressed protein 12 isoform X1 [Callithrix jacchus]
MMANHLVNPDTRNSKRPRESESPVPDSPQLPSLGKSDSSFFESSGLLYKDEALDKDLNDVSKEINLMLSTYAKLLRQVSVVYSLDLYVHFLLETHNGKLNSVAAKPLQ